jgi:DNA-binding transcriptional MerR regulator
MTEELLTIGQVAERTGRRASAIRYYEEIGLLPEPLRISGQRRYHADSLRAFAVIDCGLFDEGPARSGREPAAAV